jgi:hypothetical protein
MPTDDPDDPAGRPLGVGDFEPHVPRILAELQQRYASLRTIGDHYATGAVVEALFVDLFGGARGVSERRRFLLFVAPLLRGLLIARLEFVEVGTLPRIDMLDIRQWLARLESFDAQCVQMIDLHYFMGLSTRRTAELLGVGTKTVLRDLRFAKAWLQARSRWLEAP